MFCFLGNAPVFAVHSKKKYFMKKLFPIAMVAVVALMFTSCKKDYTCQCTATSGGTVLSTSNYTFHTTKSKAKDACSQQISASSFGSTVTMACNLK